MSERYRRLWLLLLLRRLQVWSVVVVLGTVLSLGTAWLQAGRGELVSILWYLGVFVGLMSSVSVRVTSEFRLGVLFGLSRLEVMVMQYWLSFVMAIVSGAANRVAGLWVPETATPMLMVLMALAVQFLFTMILIAVDKCRSSQTLMYSVMLCVLGITVLMRWVSSIVESSEGRRQLLDGLDWVMAHAFDVTTAVTVVAGGIIWLMLVRHESRNQVGVS